ncbi:MAG TPA: PDZ domain-containing protein, partial [Methylophilaceae bacterium]|nr:PDZ domain-containing protein [Methylophilaceae bacterium]
MCHSPTKIQNGRQSASVIARNLRQQLLIKWCAVSMLTIILGLLSVKLFAAENLYEQNYKAQSTYPLASLQANPETKMYVSNHKEDDNISML